MPRPHRLSPPALRRAAKMVGRGLWVWAPTFLIVSVVGCSAPGLRGDVYRGEGFAFRLVPPSADWTRLEATDAALAFRREENQAAILVNARCGSDGDDIPLKALTTHLFLEFTEREITLQEVVPFDGREAMHTALTAKLDGVPMQYDVWVLKKDGCVYDLLYLAPVSGFDRGYADFEKMVRGFATLDSSAGDDE